MIDQTASPCVDMGGLGPVQLATRRLVNLACAATPAEKDRSFGPISRPTAAERVNVAVGDAECQCPLRPTSGRTSIVKLTSCPLFQGSTDFIVNAPMTMAINSSFDGLCSKIANYFVTQNQSVRRCVSDRLNCFRSKSRLTRCNFWKSNGCIINMMGCCSASFLSFLTTCLL